MNQLHREEVRLTKFHRDDEHVLLFLKPRSTGDGELWRNVITRERSTSLLSVPSAIARAA